MGSSEPSTQPSGGRPLVRSRAIDSLRTALETTPTLHSDVRMQQAGADTERPTPDKRRDIAVAMNLAREAVATAAKVADDELRNLRQLLSGAPDHGGAGPNRVYNSAPSALSASSARRPPTLVMITMPKSWLGWTKTSARFIWLEPPWNRKGSRESGVS